VNTPIKSKQAGKKGKTRRKSVKLDQIIKLLFDVSKETLVTMLNSLFQENFSPDTVEIDKTATEYSKNNLDIIRADMFIKVTENTKPHHYHIEIQTEPDGQMSIRMFEYDITKALSNYRLENKTPGKIILYMPKSLVIHIEDGGGVPNDCYNVDLVLADGNVINYTVPVMRYWEYDDKELINRQLYTLLPLQVFLLRSELDKMTADNNEAARQAAILKAKNITEKIAEKIIELYDENKFTLDDADKIMVGLTEIFKHLNNRYKVNEKLNTEVNIMTRTFIDKKAMQKTAKEAKIETATKMLSNNEPINKIIDYTGLTEKEIKKIQKTL